MLKKRFQQVIDVTFHKIRQLTDTKGEEYSGAEDNQLANFQRGAATVGLIQEKVLWVYLSKHMDSIASWIRNGGVSVDQKLSEPITGRIDDAILYLLLMKAMVVDHNDVNHWAVGAGDLPVAARRKAAIGALIDNVNPDDLIPASQPRPASPASDTKLTTMMQALAILAETPATDLRVGLEMSKGSWDDPQSLRELQEFAQRTLLTRGDKQAAALPSPSERVYTHVPRFTPKAVSPLNPFNSVEHLADYLHQKGWRPVADAQFTGVTELFNKIANNFVGELSARVGAEIEDLVKNHDHVGFLIDESKYPTYSDAWDNLMRRVLNWQHWDCRCFVVAVVADAQFTGVVDVLATCAVVPRTATRLPPMTPPKDVQQFSSKPTLESVKGLGNDSPP